MDPSAGLFAAGCILLQQFRHHVARHESFTFESTLSGRTYVTLLKDARAAGFEIELHYLLLPRADFAIRRVKARVAMGGHDVDEDEIRRRFSRSRENILRCYLPLADRWVIWDGGVNPPKPLADSEEHGIEFVRTLLS